MRVGSPPHGERTSTVHGRSPTSPLRVRGRRRSRPRSARRSAVGAPGVGCESLADPPEIDPHSRRSTHGPQIRRDRNGTPDRRRIGGTRCPRRSVAQRRTQPDRRRPGARRRVARAFECSEQRRVDEALGARGAADRGADGRAQVARDAPAGRAIRVQPAELTARVEAGEPGRERVDAGARATTSVRAALSRTAARGTPRGTGVHSHRPEPLVDDQHQSDVPVDGFAGASSESASSSSPNRPCRRRPAPDASETSSSSPRGATCADASGCPAAPAAQRRIVAGRHAHTEEAAEADERGDDTGRQGPGSRSPMHGALPQGARPGSFGDMGAHRRTLS